MKIPTRVGSEAIDRRSPVGTKPRLRWSAMAAPLFSATASSSRTAPRSRAQFARASTSRRRGSGGALGASHSHHRLTVPRLSGCTNAPAAEPAPVLFGHEHDLVLAGRPVLPIRQRQALLALSDKYACGVTQRAGRICRRLAASSRRTGLIAMS